MTNISWKSGTSGLWSNAADWVGGIPNGTTADVLIGVAGAYNVTLASATTYTVDSLTFSNSTSNFSLAGALSLSGTLADFTFDGKNLYLSGSLAGGTLDIDGGTLVNKGGVEHAQNFILGAAGSIALGGTALTLGGAVTLDGAVYGNNAAGSSLVVTGNAALYNTVIENKATLVDAGTINQSYYVNLGAASTDSSAIVINSGAVYSLTSQYGIVENGTGTIYNNGGLFAITEPGGDVVMPYFSNTGTIAVGAGDELLLQGGGNLAGTLTGGGEVDLSVGTFALASGVAINAGTLGVDSGASATLGGDLLLANTLALNGGIIVLNGHNVTMASGVFSNNGEISGPGTVAITGTASNSGLYVVNGALLDITGTFNQIGGNNNLYLANGGADGNVKIEASGTLDLVGTYYGSNIQDNGSGGSLINAGLIESSFTFGGAGTGNVEGVTLINTGTILSNAGDLQFSEGGTIGGVLAGAGEFDMTGGTFSLASGLSVSVGTLGIEGGAALLEGNLTYAGTAIISGQGAIELNGYNLTLTGSSTLGGYIQGPGTLKVTGQAVANGSMNLQDGAVLEDAGTITQTTPLYFATQTAPETATLNIDANAVYDFQNQGGVEAGIVVGGTALINNAGLMELTGYAAQGQNAALSPNIINTGTIADNGAGLLTLLGSLDNDGFITVGGGSPVNAAQINVSGAITADAGKSGLIAIGANSVFDAMAAVSASETITFTTSGTAGGTFAIGALSGFAGTITGFAAGDVIDLSGVAANGFTYANNILTLTEASNGGAAATVGSLAIIGATGTFSLVADGAGGTDIVLNNPGTSYSNPKVATTTSTWNGVNAAWTAGADWSPSGVPGANNAAYIGSGTVSYNTTDTIYQLYATSATAKLTMTGGKLTVDAGGSSSGILSVSGATFDAATGFYFQGQEILASTGTLQVDAGSLLFASGNATLNGVISSYNDNGYAEFAGGNVTLGTGFSLSGAYAKIDGATVVLAAAQTIAAPVLLYSGTLNLNNHSLSLSGTSILGEATAVIDGIGTLNVTGTAQLDVLQMNGNVRLADSGLVTQNGAFTVGNASTDTSAISITSTGTYVLADNGVNGLISQGGGGSLVNAGLLETSGYGNDTQYIYLPILNTGTILVNEGTLALDGGGSLSGTLAGTNASLAGSFTITSLSASIATLNASGATLVLGSDEVFNGAFIGQGGLINLNGHNLTLSNAADTLASAVAGPGTLKLLGTVTVTAPGYSETLTNGAVLEDTGAMTQSGGILYLGATTGDTGTLLIDAGAIYNLDNNSISSNGTAGIVNNGLLSANPTSGTVVELYAPVTNTGTILATSGTLEIAGGGKLGGVIGGGAGTVALLNNFTVASGITETTSFAGNVQFGAANVAVMAFVGPGTFVADGSETIDNNGGNLIFSLGNGIHYINAGTLIDNGYIGLGLNATDTASIVNQAGAVFDMTNDNAQIIQIYSGPDSFVNAGLLEKTGGTGVSNIQATMNNSGTILVTSGVLELGYDLTNTGTILAAGGTIDINGGGKLGGVIGGGAGTVVLTNYFTVASGITETTSFGSHVQFGAANVAIMDVNGPGTFVAAGSETIDDNGGNLIFSLGNGIHYINAGTLIDGGYIGLGLNTTDTGSIVNQAGAVFDLTTDDAQIIQTYSGTYSLANAGLLEKTGGTAGSQIQATVNNTGTVLATSGTLMLAGGISNDTAGTLTGGIWEASGSGTLQLLADPSVTTDAANIILSGTASDIVTGYTSQQTIEASLTSIAATGTLQNLAGHTYAGGTTLTDSGNIILGGGKFSPAALSIAAGGTLSGFGTLAAPVQNNGNVLASGGALVITGRVAGTGTLAIGTLANLVLGTGIGAGETIQFTAMHETLTLDSPASMLGTLSGMGAGDTIDIANTVVTGASLSGTNLFITLTGGAVLTETLSSAIAGERFGITSDGAGGSNLTLYREAAGSISPSPLAFGNHHVGDTVTAGLTIANAQPADGYSESLDASFASATGGIAANGSLALVAAGGSGTLGLSLSTAAAGSIAGSAVLTLSTDGTGINGDPALGLGTQTVAVTGAVYAYASASLGATTVALGNVHVGATDTAKLVLTDSATNLSFTEALDASFTGTTGAALGTGTVSLLAAGATNSTALTVGLSTGTAGALSGTAVLGLTSDGTGLDGLGTTALASQTVSLTGAAYNYATAALAGTLSFGQHHVGVTDNVALALTNIAATGAYSEALNASFSGTALSSGSFTTAGTVTTLAAGSSNASSLLIKLVTSTAGTVAGNAFVTISSNGTGIDGLGTTSLGVDTVAVSGALFNYATAVLGTATLSLGQGHVGVADTKTLSVKNSAATGAYSEGLDAKFTGTSLTSGSFVTGGTLTALAAGGSGTALAVTLAGAAGTIAGLATLGLTSDSTGIDTLASTALTSQTVAITGMLFNYATASVAATLNLGQHHVGDVVSTGITLANAAAAGIYSEGLDTSFSGTALTHGSFAASGTVTTLAAGATNASALVLTLATGTAGTVAGHVTLALKSDGTGIDTLASTGLTSKTVAVSGAVFNYATASLASSIVSLGIVHAGDTLSKALTFSNIAATGSYSEGLDVSATGSTGSATASGSIALLKAGSSSSTGLLLSLANGGASGVISGTEILALTSDGSGIDTLGTTALGSQTITLTGTVDNYATAALAELAGNGTLTGAGNAYTLALGNMQQGAGSLTASLGVLNSATGLADLLGGNFTIVNASGAFTDSGFSSFSSLGAGQEDALPSITLSGTNAGNFSETITLASAGSNASGYNGALANLTLTVTGNVLHTYSLTSGADTLTGIGPDMIVAQAGQLSAGDIINAGSGINTLTLSGGGTFDMRAPATLTGISVVAAQEGIGTAAQTLYLDAGLAGTVNVAPGGAGSSITIYGNLDSATINLGNGNDTVYVGSALETINGGGGNDVFFTGSGNTGAAINGGTGINTLEVAGGTSFAMTGNITNIATVVVNELATQSSTLVANTIANLAIFGGNGTDTIMLGAASQTVTTGTGTTTINATAAQAGALIVNNGAATLNLTTGGNATLNANDSFLTVSLAAASNLTLSAQSFITAIGSAGNDTITALAAQQTLSGGAGVDTLIGYSGFGDTFLDTTAGLNGDTIQYFGGNDLIDITNLARAGASFTYAGNATAGTLSISQAGLGVVDTITFTSGTNLSASLFHMVSDGHGGTYLG
jgi:hypothetical protein